MAHDEVVFDRKNFVDNLANILTKEIEPIFTQPFAPRILMNAELGGTAGTNDFLAGFSNKVIGATAEDEGTLKPFVEWSQFASEYDAASVATNPTNLLNQFIFAYQDILGLPLTGTSGDWQDILIALPSAPPVDPDDPDGPYYFNVEEQFKRSFSHFLATYPYDDGLVGEGGVSGTAQENFFNNWVNYMAVTASLQDATGAISLAAYKEVYLAFGFEESEFADRLIDFYKDAVKSTGNGDPKNGWFIPSHNFDEWFEELREDFVTIHAVSSVDDIHSHEGSKSAEGLLVIDRILRLLISISDTLQLLSAAQAERIGFYTVWQEKYTDLQSKVPLLQPGGQIVGDTSPQHKDIRAQVNPSFQAMLQKVRTRRSAVQDEAKQMQTSVGQSQDTANQQVQMGTALLQQLSTILSSIFR